jgi:hypothetical protein
MTKELIDGRDKNIKARQETGENLIDYLLRRKVCFCVIQSNSWGGIMDTFVVVHEKDCFRVEERFVKSKIVRDCMVEDLEDEDFRGFKAKQLEYFKAVRLEGGMGTCWELKEDSLKGWRKIRNAEPTPIREEKPIPENETTLEKRNRRMAENAAFKRTKRKKKHESEN